MTPCLNDKLDHHWVIPAASGPKGEGVCTKCGTKRVFLNWLDTRPGAVTLEEESIYRWNDIRISDKDRKK